MKKFFQLLMKQWMKWIKCTRQKINRFTLNTDSKFEENLKEIVLGEHAQNRYLFCPYSVLSKFKGRLLDNRNWLFLNFKSLFVAIWLCCYTPGCSLNSTKKLINFWQKLFIPNLIFDLYFLRRNLLIWWRNQSVATNFF
jgi:hypothetical protein